MVTKEGRGRLVSFPDPPTKNGGRVCEMGLYVRVAEEFVPRIITSKVGVSKPGGRMPAPYTMSLLRQQRQRQQGVSDSRASGNSVSDSRECRTLSV